VAGVRGEAELVGQVGLAEQDEGDEGRGIHIFIEQEAELVEELRGYDMENSRCIIAPRLQVAPGILASCRFDLSVRLGRGGTLYDRWARV